MEAGVFPDCRPHRLQDRVRVSPYEVDRSAHAQSYGLGVTAYGQQHRYRPSSVYDFACRLGVALNPDSLHLLEQLARVDPFLRVLSQSIRTPNDLSDF